MDQLGRHRNIVEHTNQLLQAVVIGKPLDGPGRTMLTLLLTKLSCNDDFSLVHLLCCESLGHSHEVSVCGNRGLIPAQTPDATIVR